MGSNERRSQDRALSQVIVHFHFQGHEKVFEAKTRNISSSGMYVDADPEALALLNVGTSVVILVEYDLDFLVRLKGYTVRIDIFESLSGGFAVKFLELSEKQLEIIETF